MQLTDDIIDYDILPSPSPIPHNVNIDIIYEDQQIDINTLSSLQTKNRLGIYSNQTNPKLVAENNQFAFPQQNEFIIRSGT